MIRAARRFLDALERGDQEPGGNERLAGELMLAIWRDLIGDTELTAGDF